MRVPCADEEAAPLIVTNHVALQGGIGGMIRGVKTNPPYSAQTIRGLLELHEALTPRAKRSVSQLERKSVLDLIQ